MNVLEHLIICVNSVHYLDRPHVHTLVVDEIETLLDKFMGDFMEQAPKMLKQRCFDNFVNLFLRADRVILLDAFLTSKSLDFLCSIERGEPPMCIVQRLVEPQMRTVKEIRDFTAALHKAMLEIDAGKKVFIFYPYKRRCKTAGGWLPGTEQMYETIRLRTGRNGVFYNADVSDPTKKGLQDVNAAWKSLDFVITNNVITCGVNYDQQDFHSAYLFFMSNNAARDVAKSPTGRATCRAARSTRATWVASPRRPGRGTRAAWRAPRIQRCTGRSWWSAKCP